MQKMVDKRLLSRNEREAAHIYRPAVPEDRTQRRLMDQMLRRAFGGSVKKLVAAAISSGDLTDQELSEIIALINEAETDDGKLDS
jgi:predicted transcriptional regulator